jgi:hypothetical protein
MDRRTIILRTLTFNLPATWDFSFPGLLRRPAGINPLPQNTCGGCCHVGILPCWWCSGGLVPLLIWRACSASTRASSSSSRLISCCCSSCRRRISCALAPGQYSLRSKGAEVCRSASILYWGAVGVFLAVVGPLGNSESPRSGLYG